LAVDVGRLCLPYLPPALRSLGSEGLDLVDAVAEGRQDPPLVGWPAVADRYLDVEHQAIERREVDEDGPGADVHASYAIYRVLAVPATPLALVDVADAFVSVTTSLISMERGDDPSRRGQDDIDELD